MYGNSDIIVSKIAGDTGNCCYNKTEILCKSMLGKPKICQLNSEAVHVESPSVLDTYIAYFVSSFPI